MRYTAMIAIVAMAALSTLAVPAFAGTTTSKPVADRFVPRLLCLAPKVLTKECVAWGPAAPGQLFGPCLKYVIQCETQSQIQ